MTIGIDTADAAVSYTTGYTGPPCRPRLGARGFRGRVLEPRRRRGSRQRAGAGPLTNFIDLDGHSYYSNGSRSLVFDFSALPILPKYAGIAWTDVGYTDTGLEAGLVEFEAFDGATPSIGPAKPRLGDTLAAGQTTEARLEDTLFFVNFASGIGSIKISMPASDDWEIDHLQYSLSQVPLPGGSCLAGDGAGWAELGREKTKDRAFHR